MKKVFWSVLSLSTLTIIPIIPTLSSCVVNSKSINEIRTEINVLEDPNFVEIKKYTADDWIRFFNDNNIDKINEIKSAIEKNIQLTDKQFLFNENSSIISITKQLNSDNITYTSLKIEINNINSKVVSLIKNIPIFSSAYFKPPIKTSYSFEQINLSSLENTPYQSINDAQWTNAFNEYDKNTYVIPNNIYEVVSKELSSNGNYIIKYSVVKDYLNQVQSLPNADQFKDITVTVKLSPYIGKELKLDFNLDEIEIKKAFGTNATWDSINALPDLTIYTKLSNYVDSLKTIQPIRDCKDINNPNNIVGFSKKGNIINNSIVNRLTINFETNQKNVKKYRYIFILEFKV